MQLPIQATRHPLLTEKEIGQLVESENDDGTGVIPEQEPESWFVNVYEHSRNFGGHEEGGWWYDGFTPADCFETRSEQDAHTLKNHLEQTEFSNEGRRPLDSVLADFVYQVRVERNKPLPQPLGRPRYC